MEIQVKYIHSQKEFKIYILGFVLALLFLGCEAEHPGPIGNDTTPPGQVSDVKIIPTPGGANLVYTLPNSGNLSYVEAVVNTPEGPILKFNASSHKDTISVVGLATTEPQEVLLYSVSENDVRSEPVSVMVNPKTPPYKAIFESMTMSEGLGGVEINFKNESNSEVAFYIGRVIEAEFVEGKPFYFDKVKNKERNRYLFWGYPAEEQKFGVFIRDRWNHYSDTLFATLTPILEILVDKSKFKAVKLQNDSEYFTTWNQKPTNLWDGIWSHDYDEPYSGNGTNWSHGEFKENAIAKMPAAVTIDLGQEVTISRIVVNHYWQYSGDAPRKSEIYGLVGYAENTISSSLGAWHNWTLLAEIEQTKPSTTGGSAEDDKTNWENGDVVLLSPPSDPVRYVRVKAVESWNGKQNWDAAELTVYGAPVK
ncbi:DUF4959 domain-containing protein [Limibacterium fermenti]|jgi:hypothetical protein|uniref:DUF4959 domain-containing protein n=1 Tax=Limibacterium fermenti TaxID=3229863 RepID=UPI000E9D2528|nr:hypothetical protein [Porphyromonadaceae bacterium]